MQETISTLRLANGEAFAFAKDRKNSLVVDFVELFGPHYAPNAVVVHLYDRANDLLIHERKLLTQLGIAEVEQGQMADVVLYDEERHLLFLVEMLTGHGPISFERKNSLQYAFRNCHAECRFVSVLFHYDEYKQFVGHFAWGTCVWLSQMPEHIMYFE
jgi:hypothetical protein